MKVLVTGGSGFIGAWIIRRLLARGWAVRVFDINPDRRIVREIIGAAADALDWVVGDISRPDDVVAAAMGCNLTIHLAGLLTPACRKSPKRGAEVNLIGTLNVFEAARAHHHLNVVYASSAGVYGPNDGHTPRPDTHYGAFKLATEGCARAFWFEEGVSSVGFRPFVVYGPGRESGISAGPSLACAAAARGEAYTIGFTGPSDLLFVDDVAAAFEAAAVRQPKGAHVFNLFGEVADVQQVIAEIHHHIPDARIDCTGPPLPIAATLAPDELNHVLPGIPRTPLAMGVARTLQHYRALPH